MKQTILFLRGLPASGKSTFAKQYCIDNPTFRRLNKDTIREALGNPGWSREFENLVLNTQRIATEFLIQEGFSVIIDDTNFAPKHFNFYQQLAQQYSLEFTVKDFDTPLEVCIQRDSERENSVGRAVITKMFNQYLKT